MIFTDQLAKLESFQITPRFFANSLNNEEDITTYLHCLFVYEAVTPSIVDLSKKMIMKKKFFSFIESERDSNDIYTNGCFVPVVICIKSKNNYVDFFRKILKTLYLYLTELYYEEKKLSSVVKTLEFLKYCSLLINDCLVPPYDINFSIRIGKEMLGFPFESKARVGYNESAVAILLDLVDIRHIIDIWENLMNNKHVFLMSCDEYLLFLIIEAFKSLLFPLKWEDKVIPVLAPHLIDILDCPFPVLIGVNTSKIPKESALERLEEKIILDIDSNIIYYEPSTNGFMQETKPKEKIKYDEILCDCVKSLMSKKLQLAKAYYYADLKRLSIFRKLQMEDSVEDAEFVNSARKLLEMDSKEDRENLFVALVKGVFFGIIVEGLSEFELFMEKKSEGVHIFNKEKFKASQGFCRKCKSSVFWQGVIENSNFQQLVKYYKKYDQSNVQRFMEIIKHLRNQNLPSQSFYSFAIIPQVSLKNILDTLSIKIKEVKPTDLKSSFNKKSAKQVLSCMREVLQKSPHIYEDPEFNYTGLCRRTTLSFAYSRDTVDFRQYPKIFYGEFGLIRCLESIFCVFPPEAFSSLNFISKKLDEEIALGSSSSPRKYEALVLKLLYMVKNDKKLEQYQKIIDQFILISQKSPELLPGHLVFYCLDKIFEFSPVNVQILTSLEGKLGNIARDVVASKSSQAKDPDDCFDKTETIRYSSLRSYSESTTIGFTKPRI